MGVKCTVRMTTAAIVIGIDGYEWAPLSSAVNDAQTFERALVDLGLVEASNIRVLTAPAANEGDLATRRNILDALLPFYRQERSCDRLLFYYAGHGVLAFSDPAHTRPQTALVPVDVRDLDTDGDRVIVLEAMVERMRLSGPPEQYYFIDACRNMGYERHPDVNEQIGWVAMDPGFERAQAVLHAVAPLGVALGEPDGMGVMTRHLIDALYGSGIALDYSDDLSAYVVTAESIAAYVHKKVFEMVKGLPLWQRKYNLPRLNHPEPKTGPLRTIEQPNDRTLTVEIEPYEAADATDVVLSQMGMPVCSWPPNRFHQPYSVQPRRYWLDASTAASVGRADPERLRFDAREEDAATIRVWPPGGGAIPRGPAPEPGPSPPETRSIPDTRLRPRGEDSSKLTARARDPQVAIELSRVDPPYTSWTAMGTLNEIVPRGDYSIRFRLGRDTFSEGEIEIAPGRNVIVEPTIGESPLVRETLLATGIVEPSKPPTAAFVSESIGPIQAGLLATMLPLIGIKPFDLRGELPDLISDFIRPVAVDLVWSRPVSLVVAVDGNEWEASPLDVLRSLRCTLTSRDAPTLEFDLVPLMRRDGEFGRIALAIGEAPSRSFVLQVESPYIGSMSIASSALVRRVTVATLILRPNGSIDLSQNLLRLPGIQYEEPTPRIPYGRMVRELQLGQKLYQSRELVANQESAEILQELFHAKWTDPILSCMAYFASVDAHEVHGPSANDHVLGIVADNLLRYFRDLPDSRVIYGLRRELEREQLFEDLLANDELPILARSARELARYASEHGRPHCPVIEASSRAVTDQVWLMTYDVNVYGVAGAPVLTG